MMPLKAIAAHVSACYPAEGCGLVYRGPGGMRFIAIPNIAGQSDVSTRSTLDGYVMDPKAQFLAEQAADEAGEQLYAIVHSHPDVGAYFSKEDQRAALADDGQPLYPGVLYLVVSVRSGIVDGGKLFRWSGSFLEQQSFDKTAFSG